MTLDQEITREHPLYPYLDHELTQLQTLLDGIKSHRTKRSLNFIGSAWKWIAGNPDHEDFEIIKIKINNVLENNNKQVIINQLYNERINNITKWQITTILLKDNKTNKINDQLSINIQYKLRLIKEEIVNINYAIHWARVGVINSLILSSSEVKLAINTLEKENLPYATPEEALDFANTEIISNSSCLLYIIYIPMHTLGIYDKLLIKPVKQNNKINENEYEKILKDKSKIYGITNECKTINLLSICNHKNILDISNSTCLPNLLKSRPSKCNQANNQHIPAIDEISEGLLLLNQFDGNINIENEIHNLNGTYLIKFHNTSIFVTGKIFISKEQSTIKALPTILQPTPQEHQYKEILSLQMMKNIHINSTNRIELLQTEKNVHQLTSYGLILLIIIIITVFLVIRCRNNKSIRIISTTNVEKPNTTELQHSGENIASGEPHDYKI